MIRIRRMLALFAAVLALCLSLAACLLSNDEVPKDRIESYVYANREALESLVKDGFSNEKAEREGFAAEALGSETIVKSICEYSEGKIEFYCGGTGLSANSTYSGFYYSSDNMPFAFEFPTDELAETSTGVYEWKSDSGEEITTERIIPNWFYYHMVWY